MKFYGHINLRDNEMQQMVLQTENELPSTPVVGRVAFQNKRVWICIDAGVPVWVPLGVTTDTYVHTQSSSSDTWSVNHNLNANYPIVQVYDENGDMVIPGEVEIVDADNLTVSLNAASTGKVVVMYGDTSTYGGLLHPRWSYEYTQGTASTTWVIRHNLGYAPIVRVFTNDDVEILPKSVEFDDIFQVTIRFENATAGRARLI